MSLLRLKKERDGEIAPHVSGSVEGDTREGAQNPD